MKNKKNDTIEAVVNELTFQTTRSSGKGGQNVNKVSSKVILNFSIEDSQVLNENQKLLLNKKFPGKINKLGIFHISSSKDRSQFMNKKIVIDRFLDLLEQAFEPVIERIETKPSYSSKRKRLEGKQFIAEKKQSRKKISYTQE